MLSANSSFSVYHLRQQSLALLLLGDPEEKSSRTRALFSQTQNTRLELHTSDYQDLVQPQQALPGRPTLPKLLPAKQVPQHSIHGPLGLAAVIHAIAHIEFNAINLALDAIWRFSNMPEQFYLDWLRVANEESLHYQLLQERLEAIGHPYGSFPAHNHLWDMVERTKHDIVARMALVPRALEARGLDATPPLQAKLRRLGTEDALRCAEVLTIILRDEVGHVAIGNHWYRWLCERQKLDPLRHFQALCTEHDAPRLRPPLNMPARQAAGFTPEELEFLSQSVDNCVARI